MAIGRKNGNSRPFSEALLLLSFHFDIFGGICCSQVNNQLCAGRLEEISAMANGESSGVESILHSRAKVLSPLFLFVNLMQCLKSVTFLFDASFLLSQFTHLDISDNNFQVKPFCRIPLGNCPLRLLPLLTRYQQLPPQIAQCRFLRVLSAHHNRLRALPDMTDCVYLEEVLLSNNKFKSAPLGQLYVSRL